MVKWLTHNFSQFAQFADLGEFVSQYADKRFAPNEDRYTPYVDVLRFYLRVALQSKIWNVRELANKLGIGERTLRKFLDGRSQIHFRTFCTMMVEIGDDFGIAAEKILKEPPAPQLVFRDDPSEPVFEEVELPAPQPTTAAERLAHDRQVSGEALEKLEEALGGMVPAALYTPLSNREPIALSSDQYELLVATVRSARSFTLVPTWDKKVIRVIRALNDILKEIDVLLETATTVASKRVLGMVRSAAKWLRNVADAMDRSDR